MRRGALSPCQKQVPRLVKRGMAVVRGGCTDKEHRRRIYPRESHRAQALKRSPTFVWSRGRRVEFWRHH